MQGWTPSCRGSAGAIALVAAGLLTGLSAAQAQTTWKPERAIEIVVGSTPGTGTDRTARLIQKIWQEQKVMDVPVAVANRAGGGGAVAWAYLAPRAGDAHYLLMTSYNLVTNHIIGRSTTNYTDFTPISLLISEYIGYAVRAESPIKTIGDLVKMLRQDPGSVVVGTSSAAGGANHIAMGLLAKAAGVDVRRLKVVIYPGGGESLAAVLGGHVTLWVNSVSSLAPPTTNGSLRTLAIASSQRMPGVFAQVPTTREAGLNFVADNWRLMVAPRGLGVPQTRYWDTVFGRLAQSEEWNRDLTTNYFSNSYRNSADTLKYIAEEYSDIKAILTDLGLAQAPK